MSHDDWVPEIMYEEAYDENITSHIPFIPVPNDREMPPLLYMFESRETGEYEPGPEGEELPVTEMELHQYADMAILKNRLSSESYDMVRVALGLEPMDTAVAKGKQITDNIRQRLDQTT